MCLVNNQQIMMAFGGIVHAHKATLLTPAVVLNIEAYTFDETGLFNYIELPTGTKLKGVAYQNRVYLLVTPNKALIPAD
ncbi:hypothetical protein CWC06_09555 [Pseudoalteromonas ruthenica]|nr:hypothetical protein CWC06_09555 [Pseudoalteromonas ruthenica]